MSIKIKVKRPSIVEFVNDALAASPKTQKEIADEMGLENSNVITMYKNGTSRIPLNRTKSFAIAVGVDPLFLMRLALIEYYPEVHSILESVLPAPILTKNEEALIKSFRKMTDYSDPPFLFTSNETKVVASCFIEK
jgi:hypothetical protein